MSKRDFALPTLFVHRTFFFAFKFCKNACYGSYRVVFDGVVNYALNYQTVERFISSHNLLIK